MDDLSLFGQDEVEYPAAFQWEILEGPERIQRSQELAAWVDWLVNRYRLHRTVRPCWWQHGPHVEELSALWIAWRGLHEAPDRADGWVWWHDHLARMLGRMRDHWNTGCDTEHSDVVPGPHPTGCEFSEVV